MTLVFHQPEPPEQDDKPMIPSDSDSNPDEERPVDSVDETLDTVTGRVEVSAEEIGAAGGETQGASLEPPVSGPVPGAGYSQTEPFTLPESYVEPAPPPSEPGVQRSGEPPLSQQDERTWSMLAHLSMLLNPVTVVLGPVAALIIYLAYKDRSRVVAFHAMQSFIFQLITWIGSGLLIGAIWLVTVMLIPVVIGLICIPFSLLITILLIALPIVGLVYSIYGAIQINNGQPFSYWLVGDWVRDTLA